MKKSQERPIEKESRSKEDIDRGIAIRTGLIEQTKQNIADIIQQMGFANPDGGEYKYLDESLKIERNFLNQMKNG